METVTPALATDASGALVAIAVPAAQAVTDCQARRLMRERQLTSEASVTLAAIYDRYHRCGEASEWRETVAGLSGASFQPGPLASVGTANPLSHVGRTTQ